MGLVIARSVDEGAREAILAHNAVALDQVELLEAVARWDWRKQEAAVQGLTHFLAHVEQNPDAVNRLLAFIAGRDPSHESLVYVR